MLKNHIYGVQIFREVNQIYLKPIYLTEVSRCISHLTSDPFIKELHFFFCMKPVFATLHYSKTCFLFLGNCPDSFIYMIPLFLGASLTTFGSGYPRFRYRSSLLAPPAAPLRWPASPPLLSLAHF